MDRSDTPGVIAPPPLIALATVAVGLLLDWLWPAHALRDHFGLPARLIVGGALIGAGAALAIAAERTFHRIGTNAPPWKPALRLATDGVYTHLRNPMYAGGLTLLAGLGFALASVWMLVMLVPAALVLHYGVVRREERYLEERFGADYRAFKARVPRYGWRL
jgi:protein-S-isoprenylcysteine O-methyltransferase Ste14